MKSGNWLLRVVLGALLLSAQTVCFPENNYGEKSDERKTKKENERNMLFENQAEVPQNDRIRKTNQSILGTCFEAMAVAGQALGQAMDNLFAIRIYEEAGWKTKEYSKTTNQPISTLKPVLDNLQKAGSP